MVRFLSRRRACPPSPGAGWTAGGAPPADVRLGPVGSGGLADDFDAHAPGGAFDLTRGRVYVIGVEVGHLDRSDFTKLVAGHLADGLPLGGRPALVQAGGLAQEICGGRRLEDERERTVLEDSDLGRDDLAGLVGGLLVV